MHASHCTLRCHAVRFVTLNLWGERGPLAARWPLVSAGLVALDADVICLQEVRALDGSVPNQAEALGARLGRHVTFAPAMEWGGGIEGVALLTRDRPEDVQIEELPDATPALRRVGLSARVLGPDGPVRVATTHLHYRLEHGLIRERQVRALEALARRGGEPVTVIAGDLNATPDSDEVRWLTGKTTIDGRRTFFQDAWDVVHPGDPGHTWARENHFTDHLRWLHPGRRIDYVLVSPEEPGGRGRIRDCRLALTEAGPQGDFASDHWAVVADVQVSDALTPPARGR